MKTLSVLLTLALFAAANGLAVWLKHEAVQPAPRKDMARASNSSFHRVNHGTYRTGTRTPIYE